MAPLPPPPPVGGGPQAAQRGGGPSDASVRKHVEEILELMRPAIREDEGDVELVDVSADGIVRVRFHGACVGCPSSAITLQAGIERSLKQHVPEVKAVQSVA